MQAKEKITSAFYITFNGNCKKALSLYQNCFGGRLHFDTFKEPIAGLKELPVINGSLVSGKVTIFGSDLVHNEGRKTGNAIAIYIQCDSHSERLSYLQKLDNRSSGHDAEQKLLEITDPFGVVWVFGI